MDDTIQASIKDKLDANKLLKLDYEASGCISKGYAYLVDDKSKIFVKINDSIHSESMFTGEYESLLALQSTQTITVPKPLFHLESALVLEYLDLQKSDDESQRRFAIQLANLHDYNRKYIKFEKKASGWIGNLKHKYLQQTEPITDTQKQNSSDEIVIEQFRPHENVKLVEKFGFDIPTSCGLLPQINEWTSDWISFYARYRLDKPIRDLLLKEGDRKLIEKWSLLQLKVDKFFDDYERNEKICPALLHGDLWSGNLGRKKGISEPVAFDPSSFYGHNEYEFGIIRMFGGFSDSFEKVYFDHIEKKKNFEDRNKLYQLFHHLNHWNLFGSSYRSSSLNLMEELIKLRP